MSIGDFVIRNNKREENSFSNVHHPSVIAVIVRTENLPKSNQWKGFYESVKEYDGDKLGILLDSSFEDLTKENFPKSEYVYYNWNFELYQALLLEEIERFLIDEPNSEYFKVVNPEITTYFIYNFKDNIYAFGFQKMNKV